MPKKIHNTRIPELTKCKQSPLESVQIIDKTIAVGGRNPNYENIFHGLTFKCAKCDLNLNFFTDQELKKHISDVHEGKKINTSSIIKTENQTSHMKHVTNVVTSNVTTVTDEMTNMTDDVTNMTDDMINMTSHENFENNKTNTSSIMKTENPNINQKKLSIFHDAFSNSERNMKVVVNPHHQCEKCQKKFTTREYLSSPNVNKVPWKVYK